MSEKRDPCKELMDCIREYHQKLIQILRNWVWREPPNTRDLTQEYYSRIKSLLENHTMDTCLCRPIHRLVDSSRIHINFALPLDILQLLVSKFDVNAYDSDGKTCLHVALDCLRYGHWYGARYGAIRVLVEHGADPDRLEDLSALALTCNDGKTPIALLARERDVPLDIFDLLSTDHNLNSSTLHHLPLHVAIACGRLTSAVHLIRIGARVNQKDANGRLPVSYYNFDVAGYKDELFTQLINTQPYLLRMFGPIVDAYSIVVHNDKILERLFERMIPQSNINILCHIIDRFRGRDEWVVEIVVGDPIQLLIQESKSFRGIYLTSLLLILMDWNIVLRPLVNLSPPASAGLSSQDVQQLEDIKNIWRIYAEKSRVRPLFKLCIIQIKRSMNSLNEENFQSLPLPPTMRNRLMYRDVEKMIYEAYCDSSDAY